MSNLSRELKNKGITDAIITFDEYDDPMIISKTTKYKEILGVKISNDLSLAMKSNFSLKLF